MPNDPKEQRIAVNLTPEQIKLLAEALDSHAYWQLSDEVDRNDGFIHGPSADRPEVTECQKLGERLEALLPIEPLKKFKVRWEIDVEAATPELAALQARACQAPGTTALFFWVSPEDDSNEFVKIELGEEPPCDDLPEHLKKARVVIERMDGHIDVPIPDVEDTTTALQEMEELLRSWNNSAAHGWRLFDNAARRMELKYALSNALEALLLFRDVGGVSASYWKEDGVGATAISQLQALQEQLKKT